MVSIEVLLKRRFGTDWEWDMKNQTWWSSDGKRYVTRAHQSLMKSLELYSDNELVTTILVADLRRQYTHAPSLALYRKERVSDE